MGVKINKYSTEELALLKVRVDNLRVAIEENIKVLDFAVEHEELVSENTNVIHICPNVAADFHYYAEKEKSFHEILPVFEEWIEEVTFTIQQNVETGQLKNMRLQDHLRKNLEYCSAIGAIADYYLKI